MVRRLLIIYRTITLCGIFLFQEMFTHLRMTNVAAVFYKFHSKVSQSSEAESSAHLGSLYERVGDFEKATNLYTNALRLEPKKSIYYADLAAVYEKQDNAKLAIENYEKFLEIDHEQPVHLKHLINDRLRRLRENDVGH